MIGGVLYFMKDSTHITKRRRDAVDALFSEDGSLDEILIQRGIAPGVFLSWLDDPAFSLYLQKQVQARAQAAVLSAWKSLARGVERGESNALKLFFELKNRHTDEKNAFDIHMDEESRKAAA